MKLELSLYGLLLIIIFVLAMKVRQDRMKTGGIALLMQGAAHSLVRHMENDPLGTPSKLAKGREALLTRIAIEGAEKLKVVAGTAMPQVGLLAPPPVSSDPQLTAAAQALLVQNESSASEFWFKTQGIRTGAQIFLALTSLGNPVAAYILMTEHCKKQRDEWELKKQKRLPNFTELKMVLGLPTPWPEGLQPEEWQRRGISRNRAKLVIVAIRRYRDKIFAGVVYKPWPRKEDDVAPTYEGAALLEGLREYIR